MKNSTNQNKNFTINSLAALVLITLISLYSNAQVIKKENLAVNISFNNEVPNSKIIEDSEYKKIANAESLEVSGQKLESLPGYIFKMENLEDLSVKSNDLNDISRDIGRLYNLRVLDLSQTSVQNIPDEISQLKHLKEIHLPYMIWEYRIDEVKKLTKANIILD